MAGIYFILPKTGRRGYIGLDSYMTQSNYPRLVDHVAAAYRVFARDVYKGRGNKVHSEGDLITGNIQNCEIELNNNLPCNYDYYVTYYDEDCYGLGYSNFEQFSKIWTIGGKYAEPAKAAMSWAEVCYVYKYMNSFSALNEQWGGAGSFTINPQYFDDVSIGDTSLHKLIEQANISWVGRSVGSKGKHFAAMDELFFPFAKVFNYVVHQYINTTLAQEIASSIKATLIKKETWASFILGKKSCISEISYNFTDLDKLYTALTKHMPGSEYIVPDLETLKTKIGNQVKPAIQEVLDALTSRVFTGKGKIHGGYKFLISCPERDFSARIKNSRGYPSWWPDAKIPKHNNVAEEMKKLVQFKIFPYITLYSCGNKGINKDLVTRYLNNVIPNLTSNTNYTEGFYYPCRNAFLDNREGVAQIVNDDGVSNTIYVYRPAWEPDACEKMKRSAFLESRDLKELLVW